MNEILMQVASSVVALLVLLAGFAVLVRLARHDSFAGPGTGHQASDELGPLSFRRRPA